ncbi:thioesterase II family protein [Streptomyces sp. NPDC001970]
MSLLRSQWFRQYQRDSASGLRLFCFPHAGGAASTYVPLARALAPAAEVVAIQYPGRQDRRNEPPVESVTGLAELIADELLASFAEHEDGNEDEDANAEGRHGKDGRPYAFFGHSMGSAIAYETVRLLEAREAVRRPVRLFLSGRGAPTPGPRSSDRLSGDAALIAEIRRLGGTGSRVLDEPELLEMVLPALRADYAALRTYAWEPGPPLRTPITVLVGDSDPVVPADDARGWLEHSAVPGEFRTFPGGHFYLDGRTQEVAHLVAATLEAATAR